jgi:hypothetical protein
MATAAEADEVEAEEEADILARRRGRVYVKTKKHGIVSILVSLFVELSTANFVH